MRELHDVYNITLPCETLLVADSMIGQDSINIAKEFSKNIPITGIFLTRVDGDARGGTALSMSQITSCPVKMIGTGEKISDIDYFDPDHIAKSILGMGSIIKIVEKASRNIQKKDAETIRQSIQNGKFTMDDFLIHIRQVRKIDNFSLLINSIPGIQQIKKKLSQNEFNDATIAHQEAIILSM